MRILLSAICLLVCPVATAHAGTISGRVTDRITGAPVPDLRVGAGPVGYGLREYVQTDADGRYTIDEPDAGMFNVCFLPGRGMNFLERCWRDEQAPFYGTNIAVPAEGVVPGIDTTLAPGTSATGVVRGWDRQPLAGVCVVAWGPQSGGIGRKADVVTAADGSYTLTGLEPDQPTKLTFGPRPVGGMSGCEGGTDHPGLVEQWFDRQAGYDPATAVAAQASETVGGIDAYLGPEVVPPAGVVPARRACVVPRLRGRTFTVARDRLSDAGCSTLKPTLRTSRVYARGQVIKASVAAKKRVRRGRAIRLTVSRGRR